jgi:SAM-dependent methyltransferase
LNQQRRRDYRALDLHRLMEHDNLDDLRGRHRIARELLQPAADDTALEVGCAQGYWVNLYLRQRVRRVVGLDIDPEDVGRARAYAARHPEAGVAPEFVIGSAESLPLPAGAFSLVYCMDVLEHVEAPPRAAAEVRRILAPGGRLVVTVPGHWLLNFLDPHYPEHRHYQPAQIIDLFPGLDVCAIHRTGLLWSAFWGTYVRFVLARATRLIPRLERRATALRTVNTTMARIADLDCRRNYGFGAALAVVFRRPLIGQASAGDARTGAHPDRPNAQAS